MTDLLITFVKFFRQIFGFVFRPMLSYSKKYYDYWFLRYHGVETKFGHVILLGRPIIHKHKTARIIIGEGTTLISKSKYNSAGVNHPVILAAIRDGAILHIHGSFGASGSAIVAMNSVEIEKGAGLGANSHVYDTDFHPVGWAKNDVIKTAPVKIGKNVWVAASCLILKGVTIGENTVIGAGSIVTRSADSNSLYAGVPAKKISSIEHLNYETNH